MRASLWSLGFVMIALGLLSVMMGRYYGVPLTVSTVSAAGAMVVGGAALLLKRPVSFWIAFGATALTVGMALGSMISQRAIGLQPPIIPLVIGLYICFRLVLARSALRPRPPIADDNN